MKENIYSRRSNLVIGFHGCDKSVVEKVLLGQQMLLKSANDYDWLGHGIYFWENNSTRALRYSQEIMKRKSSSIKEPAIIGAVIDLGNCMDLMDSMYLQELEEAYKVFSEAILEMGRIMPENTNIGNSTDKLIRRLDCAVIESAHKMNEGSGGNPFDSVRGVFWEGKELYPGAGFTEKNHIQICVRNPNCIKGFFLPREIDDNYLNP